MFINFKFLFLNKVPFNKPVLTGNELININVANKIGKFSGDGLFTKKCHKWLEKNIKTKKALLTHSCTSALEMSALLLDLKKGDEIIMPSYTFEKSKKFIFNPKILIKNYSTSPLVQEFFKKKKNKKESPTNS